jgi:hypothetical protein
MAAYTTIDDPSAYFKVQLYTGNGSANHAITFDDTDTDMQPDMVWIKNRDATDSHCLFDAVRGATKVFHTDAVTAEVTDADTLDSFTSDGFQVDADVKVNTNTEKYVAWCWKANGSGSSNTDGSINTGGTSANTTAGFSINTYTGTGANATVGHGLGAIPHVIVCKSISNGLQWFNYHQAVGNQRYMNWDDAGGRNDSDSANFWNSTTPTSTVFSIGVEDSVNGSTKTFVAYCWAPIQGFSKFGSFVGNGNTNGTFVYTGFRPAFVILKTFTRAGTDDWRLYDNKRLGYNVDNNSLMPNTTAVPRTNDDIDLLSNGFKLRNTPNDVNPNGETALYMAFAEAPFVNSNGVPCNAR